LNITAPANHIVVCSGELVNPTAVYSTAEQTRLAQAKLSDKTVLIRTQKKKAMATAASIQKLGIINLKCRDLSWASSAFILDGAKINLPSGKNH
jgi:hypothetical protein